MKAFYLTASIIFTILILVIAFENINAQCTSLMFFFYNIRSNPTLVTLGIAILGIFTGIFYHSFLSRVVASNTEEEDEDF